MLSLQTVVWVADSVATVVLVAKGFLNAKICAYQRAILRAEPGLTCEIRGDGGAVGLDSRYFWGNFG